MLSTIQAIFRALGDAVRPWVVLAPWEAGIRIRLGRTVTLLGPGFNWRIPGIDRIDIQTTRLRMSTLMTQTLTARNGRIIVLAGNVGYAIRDIVQLYNSLHHAEDTIRYIAAEALASAALSVEEHNITPESIAKLATDRTATKLERFGLDQVSVCLTDFAFVRAYRLISDQKYGGYGDTLTTVAPRS